MGADLAPEPLAQVLEAGAYGEAALGEGRLRAAVDDLEEELAHCRVDRVANQVRIERLEDGLAGQDLGRHGCGVGHPRAADSLDESLLDDALLHVEGELAGALLRGAPADAVGKSGDILDFLGTDPLPLRGDGEDSW